MVFLRGAIFGKEMEPCFRVMLRFYDRSERKITASLLLIGMLHTMKKFKREHFTVESFQSEVPIAMVVAIN